MLVRADILAALVITFEMLIFKYGCSKGGLIIVFTSCCRSFAHLDFW
jgi:hypothetical protein